MREYNEQPHAGRLNGARLRPNKDRRCTPTCASEPYNSMGMGVFPRSQTTKSAANRRDLTSRCDPRVPALGRSDVRVSFAWRVDSSDNALAGGIFERLQGAYDAHSRFVVATRDFGQVCGFLWLGIRQRDERVDRVMSREAIAQVRVVGGSPACSRRNGLPSHESPRPRRPSRLRLRSRELCGLAQPDDVERDDRALKAGERHLADRLDFDVVLHLRVQARCDEDLSSLRRIREP